MGNEGKPPFFPEGPDVEVRLVVVESRSLIREGLCELLLRHQDMEVVGTSASLADSIALLAEVRPSVVLAALELCDGSGLELISRIRRAHLDARVLIVGSEPDPALARRALAWGAAGYLLDSVGADELAGAIRVVAAGAVVLDHVFAALASSPEPVQPVRGQIYLTMREEQILECLAAGWGNRRIAEEHGLSVRTVEGHISKVLTKLGVDSRTEAALWAVRHGCIPAQGHIPQQ
ncbi:MAG: response regulator transcription factor [Actinomycetota bacterium]|nr:response regulator transcription factor [Actinomycetota bacterium]